MIFPVTHCSRLWSQVPLFQATGFLVLRVVRSSGQCCRFPRESLACEWCLISARGKRAGKIYICTLARLSEPARGAPKIRDHSEFKKALTFPSPRPLCPIPHLKLRILSLFVPFPLSLTVWYVVGKRK